MDTGPDQGALLRRAAFIAGLGVLIMALTVPVVEFYIFPLLIDHKNAAQTTNNIADHPTLFSAAIFIHFVTVICDITVAWALYIFLRPAGKNLALLTAWFRLVYAAFNVVALLDLVQVLSLLRTSKYFSRTDQGQVNDFVLFYVRSFDLEWRFGLVFFGVYLCLLGYLVFRSGYVPRIIGICLGIAGLGYLTDDLKYFFYPGFNTGFLWFTFLGELIFMIWLLVKGVRIRQFTDPPGQ